MRRIEPPATATWLLEHFTPGERNEALAGDLLEEFQNGLLLVGIGRRSWLRYLSAGSGNPLPIRAS